MQQRTTTPDIPSTPMPALVASDEPSDVANKATASSTRVLHQRTELNLTYLDNQWDYLGRTTLWLIQSNSNAAALSSQSSTAANGSMVDFALHFRGEVESVSVATVNQRCQMKDLKCDYVHLDTLDKVMLTQNPNRIDADSQCCRGASFGLALRAAAAASFLGELRIKCDLSTIKASTGKNTVASTEDFAQMWLDDICHDKSKNGMGTYFSLEQKESLNVELQSRDRTGRRENRIDLISRKLGEASSDAFPGSESSESNNSSPPLTIRVTVQFRLPNYVLGSSLCKGVCVQKPSQNDASLSPHVYTTSGDFGDHEGPRMWLPCLDSSSGRHRASHELLVCVTSLMDEGISVVGCGEDSGASSAVFCERNSCSLATYMWLSHIWSPIPARCLGFAVGPFKIINDLEYLDDTENDQKVSIGEGIRNVYLAIHEERPFLHSAQMIHSFPESRDVELSIVGGTSGVPLRALNVAKDVIGLPFHHSSSYTQVWLPYMIDGGASSGALQQCGVATNCWLGGAVLDASLLPPIHMRFPFYRGGKSLQLAQARCVMMGFVRKGVSLGSGQDDVGEGWIHALFVAELMRIYELAHGASGEGGSPMSHFFVESHAAKSGPNSQIMEFINFPNVEDDVIGVGPTQEMRQDLWRSKMNGTESRTAAIDEVAVRRVLSSDALEAIERNGPLPSMGWKGSHLSLTFLSSNSCNSTTLGCGSVELLHPVGGSVYRHLKASCVARACSARAGTQTFIKAMRACFYAGVLAEFDEESTVPIETISVNRTKSGDSTAKVHKAPFILSIDEIMKKGTTSVSFVRSLRHMAGIAREQFLRGTLVDVGKEVRNSSGYQVTDQELFPNSLVRGWGGPYLRVGTHIEAAAADSLPTTTKGILLHVVSESVIHDKGLSFGGPLTIRVVENEGQTREFVRALSSDGSRMDWGPIYLHAKPVASNKQQTAASGTMESDSKQTLASKKKGGVGGDVAYNEKLLHVEGYEAIELARLTNRTPLLWLKVDPHGVLGGMGKIATFQQDACVAEQLFNDADASSQIEALRSLAERPFRIQGSLKVTSVYDAKVTEIPVRVLGDCLRGSVALHSSMPHTPVVRAQAALAIAQWQNNKAPASIDILSSDAWLGLDILFQYFRERFEDQHGLILPIKFYRRIVREVESTEYTYSAKDNDEVIEDDFDFEEDEEYRVRSAVITAIACIRTKDGQTPTRILQFLERILLACAGSSMEREDYPINAKRSRLADNQNYFNDPLVADVLLSLCHVNTQPAELDATFSIGDRIQGGTSHHPVLNLLHACKNWLTWGLYEEKMSSKCINKAVSGVGLNSVIAPSALTALCSLALLHQSTSLDTAYTDKRDNVELHEVVSVKFYANIVDSKEGVSDITRAAAAQAVACIYCGSDRLKDKNQSPIGLLAALEFLLQRIYSAQSMSTQLTFASLMLDACTGRICSMQRVAILGYGNDLSVSGARFFNGPLGGSQGGDSGSSLLMTVSKSFYPAAASVNNGARIGLRLLKIAGSSRDKEHTPDVIARVGKFATLLWRTINGDTSLPGENGLCSRHGSLRVALLSLWDWIWPSGCPAIAQVQTWRQHEASDNYEKIGAHEVMKISEEEKKIAMMEDIAIGDFKRVFETELDRQNWREEMSSKAYESSSNESAPDSTSISHGLGIPLPLVSRDETWRLGNWSASAAHQRRAKGLDGGAAVSKVRLKIGGGGISDKL